MIAVRRRLRRARDRAGPVDERQGRRRPTATAAKPRPRRPACSPRSTRRRRADNASATVVAGEAVDLDLPARDPEGQPLEYEIVDEPSTGSVQMRDPSPVPTAADVTYTAGEAIGPVTFTYRVKAGRRPVRDRHRHRRRRQRRADRSGRGRWCRASRRSGPTSRRWRARGSRAPSPIDQRVVEELTGEAPKVITTAEQVGDAARRTSSCVSRRNFRIRDQERRLPEGHRCSSTASA